MFYRSALKADIEPMSMDSTCNWDNVGGLESHINSLKEMVILPLLYPDIFRKFGVTPPRGVLFYGPPGTGFLFFLYLKLQLFQIFIFS